jgi:hypothetical protein
LEVSTLPLVPGATACKADVPLPKRTLLAVSVVAPVPPEDTESAFAKVTTWDELTVIAVVSPVWMSSEFELSPVEISPPGDVVVLLMIDAIVYSCGGVGGL